MTAHLHSVSRPAPHVEKPIPRAALLSAAALVVLAMIAAIAGRVADIGALRAPAVAPVAERVLRFELRGESAIAVSLGDATAPAAVLPPEENGFIRGVLRGLAHERKLLGVAYEAPYRLVRSEGGRLTLIDPATRRRIELFGFGAANLEAFERLMTLQ